MTKYDIPSYWKDAAALLKRSMSGTPSVGLVFVASGNLPNNLGWLDLTLNGVIGTTVPDNPAIAEGGVGMISVNTDDLPAGVHIITGTIPNDPIYTSFIVSVTIVDSQSEISYDVGVLPNNVGILTKDLAIQANQVIDVVYTSAPDGDLVKFEQNAPVSISDGKLRMQIDTDDLPAGSYELKVVVKQTNNTVLTYNIGFAIQDGVGISVPSKVIQFAPNEIVDTSFTFPETILSVNPVTSGGFSVLSISGTSVVFRFDASHPAVTGDMESYQFTALGTSGKTYVSGITALRIADVSLESDAVSVFAQSTANDEFVWYVNEHYALSGPNGPRSSGIVCMRVNGNLVTGYFEWYCDDTGQMVWAVNTTTVTILTPVGQSNLVSPPSSALPGSIYGAVSTKTYEPDLGLFRTPGSPVKQCLVIGAGGEYHTAGANHNVWITVAAIRNNTHINSIAPGQAAGAFVRLKWVSGVLSVEVINSGV